MASAKIYLEFVSSGFMSGLIHLMLMSAVFLTEIVRPFNLLEMTPWTTPSIESILDLWQCLSNTHLKIEFSTSRDMNSSDL